MNIKKTEHVAKVSNFFKSLVRLGLLNHLHLLHTYQEESSKDLSVLYAETNRVHVLWQSSKETEAQWNPDVGPHMGDHKSFSPALPLP